MGLGVLLAVILIVFVSSCQHHPGHDQMMGNGYHTTAPPQNSDNDIDNEPDVVFTLRTELRVGGFAFVGVGSSIEGQKNPTLEARVGEVIEVVLIDGDAVLHDFVIPELNVTAGRVSSIGQEISVRFRVETAGEYAYFCSVSGHRSLGMEGVLRVTP